MTPKAKPTVYWIDSAAPLPPAREALREPASLRGLVAAGEDLSVPRLLEAYGQGIFPWFSQGQPVLWWSPDPRMVLQTAQFKLHPSLRKTLRRFRHDAKCEIRIDHAFDSVIRHCAERPRPGQSGTWIVPQMVQAYNALHQAGHAHSVETWIDGQLVGGLYAVSIGKAIFGESMFALRTDASKIALAALIAFARAHDMPWIDCQQNTRHLASLGAAEMPREEFLGQVLRDTQTSTPRWKFESIYWDFIDPFGAKPQ